MRSRLSVVKIQTMALLRLGFILITLFLSGFSYSEQEPSSILQNILNDSLQDTTFNKTYIYNGCFIRAHALAIKLKQAGVESKKIFLTAENSQKIYFPHSEAKKRPAHWTYHVMTVVENLNSSARQDDVDSWFVLDPTFSDKPLKISEVIGQLKKWPENSDIKFNVEIVDSSQLTPEKEYNQEFKKLGNPFGAAALDFIQYEMENLFLYEKAEAASQ